MGPKKKSDHQIDWFVTKFIRIPTSLLDVEGMSDSAFRIYSTIARFDPCYPGYADLMRLTGKSKGTVSKAIKFLARRRMIEYIKGGSFRGKNSRYSLCSTNSWDWDGSKCELSHESDPAKRVHNLNRPESENRTQWSSESEPHTVQKSHPNETKVTKSTANETNVSHRAEKSADDGQPWHQDRDTQLSSSKALKKWIRKSQSNRDVALALSNVPKAKQIEWSNKERPSIDWYWSCPQLNVHFLG